MPKRKPKVTIDPTRFYSAAAAATFLGVTPETVKTYCRDGKLKGERVGPKQIWHILGSELQELHARWRLDALE